jgi:hypothetical protein
VKVKVEVTDSPTYTSVEVRLDASGGGYGRPEPVVGTLDKAMVQARQTAVAIVKERRA